MYRKRFTRPHVNKKTALFLSIALSLSVSFLFLFSSPPHTSNTNDLFFLSLFFLTTFFYPFFFSLCFRTYLSSHVHKENKKRFIIIVINFSVHIYYCSILIPVLLLLLGTSAATAAFLFGRRLLRFGWGGER